MTPSTTWQERIADDEAERFARHAASLVAMQRSTSNRLGPGRALHRKQHLGLQARLHVHGALPEYAQHGLFAHEVTYDALVRLSNGSGDVASDRQPDVRGFAFAVTGLSGESVFGGPATTQCFALIPFPALPFPTVDEFMGFALASAKGPVALARHLARRYGLGGAFRVGRRLASSFAKPFTGFASTTFFSAAPIACGPYAIRVRLAPIDPGEARSTKVTFADDMKKRLRRAPLRYELAIQFFADEARTPIEDPSIDWDESVAPYVRVAELEIPMQDPDSIEGRALAESIEHGIFDPWTALAAHRPLGEIMRARKVAYFESQKARGAR